MGIKKINLSLLHGHRQEYDHTTRGGVPGRGKAVPNMTAGLLKPETGETRAGIASSPLSATCEELQEEIEKLKILPRQAPRIHLEELATYPCRKAGRSCQNVCKENKLCCLCHGIAATGECDP